MKTAKEFAEEAMVNIHEHPPNTNAELNILEALFQAALDTPVPIKFVDGFVPDEDGHYWYETSGTKNVLFVEVFIKSNKVFIDGNFWMNLSSATGRFTHRLMPPEGE